MPPASLHSGSLSSSVEQIARLDRTGHFYRPELDALRFFAFLAVFIYHAFPRDIVPYTESGLPTGVAQWVVSAKIAGGFGVDLFFALSSYLITELLIREHLRRGTIDLRAFYIRRALRIWPLYFTFLAATVLLFPLIVPAEDFNWKYVLSFALFVGNWACAFGDYPNSVAKPLWSVSVEEQFYLAWPALIICFGVKRIKRLAITLLAVAWATRITLVALDINNHVVWCNTFARLDPIALGALVAVSLRGGAPKLNSVTRGALCCAGLALWVLVWRYFSLNGPGSLVIYPIGACGSAMLLLAFLRSDRPSGHRSRPSVLIYLGRISYGLYVFHLLAITVLAQEQFVPFTHVQLNFGSRLILSFFLTVLLAAVSYRWLEQPFLRLKDRFTYVPSHPHFDNARPAVVDVDEKARKFIK